MDTLLWFLAIVLAGVAAIYVVGTVGLMTSRLRVATWVLVLRVVIIVGLGFGAYYVAPL